MLDQALEALKTYNWGMDPNLIKPIDEAIVASYGDSAARKNLETRLIEILKGDAPQAAKDATCRALKIIGTAASVPALADLLVDEKLSHMARYALEQNPAPEAAKALQEALPKAGAKQKAGIASTLGVRSEATSVAPLQTMLADADPAVSRSAAWALGKIGTKEAHQALAAAKPNDSTNAVIADSLLGIAQQQRLAGKKSDAKATYEKILGSNPSKAIKLAATRGIEACSGS